MLRFAVVQTIIRRASNAYSPTFESNTKIQSIFDMCKFLLSIRHDFQHDKERFSAKAGETENVALLLCCFVALSIVHTCMPSSLLSN